MWHIQGKELKFIEGKFHPRKGYGGPERGEVYRSVIILTSALDPAGLEEEEVGGGGRRRRWRRMRKRRRREGEKEKDEEEVKEDED